MTINIRKRGQDVFDDQKVCRQESPEKQNKKLRNDKSMKGGEAASILMKFWSSKPDDSDFHHLVTYAIHAIKQFRQGLVNPSTTDEYKRNILESGLLAPIFFLIDLPRFFGRKISTRTIHLLQFEAAWTITNLSSGDGAAAVMEYQDSLDILGRVIGDGSTPPALREQAIWCVANVAGYDSGRQRPYCTRILGHQQIVQGLLESTLHPPNPEFLKTSLWAIGNVIQGRSSPESKLLLEVILQTIKVALKDDQLIDKLRDEIISNSYSALRKAMLEHSEIAEYVGNIEGFVSQTMKVLQEARIGMSTEGVHDKAAQREKAYLVHQVVRCVGLLLTFGSDEIHQTLIDEGFLAEANHLLNQPYKEISQETCSALASFVRRGDPGHILAFRAKGCLASLVDVASNSPWKVKKEALMALLGFLIWADQKGHRHFFSTSVGAQVLCDSLKIAMETDVGLCRIALDAVETILKTDRDYDGELSICDKLHEYRGLETIECLQTHHMKDVREKAINIIDNFFILDENETEEPEAETQDTRRCFKLSSRVSPTDRSRLSENRSALFS